MQVRENAERIAAENGIEIEYIRKVGAFRKDDRIEAIIEEKKITNGLVHIFSAMEGCHSYDPWHDKTSHQTFLKYSKGQCIRPHYHHVESCQETVPEAITAFLEGIDFEDVIRTAVSLGGDCDTLTCIAGGIAEAFYGLDSHLKQECESRLPEDMLAVLTRFNRIVSPIKNP